MSAIARASIGDALVYTPQSKAAAVSVLKPPRIPQPPPEVIKQVKQAEEAGTIVANGLTALQGALQKALAIAQAGSSTNYNGTGAPLNDLARGVLQQQFQSIFNVVGFTEQGIADYIGRESKALTITTTLAPYLFNNTPGQPTKADATLSITPLTTAQLQGTPPANITTLKDAANAIPVIQKAIDAIAVQQKEADTFLAAVRFAKNNIFGRRAKPVLSTPVQPVLLTPESAKLNKTATLGLLDVKA
jgi:hypothetical protein